MANRALSIEGLHKRFGDHIALDSLDLSLPQGKVLALLGPSGCGKTTLLRCIAGLVEIDGGRILLGGECVAEPRHQRSPDERRLGMVFQDYALWPHMSVAQNVAFPLEMLGIKADARRPQVEWALDLVGLRDFAKRAPGELSGGQQQRVALARAIVARPRLLLMDEPLSNLDKSLRENLALEIRSLIEQLNLTAVFVTHDQHEAFALADQVAILLDGKLQQMAAPETLFRHPETPTISNFLDAGPLLSGHLDAHGLNLAGRRLPLFSPELREGSVRVLLPRHALALCPTGQGQLEARLTGRVFQGEHFALRLTLDDGSEVTINVREAPAKGQRVGLALTLPALQAWAEDGTRVRLEQHASAFGHPILSV